MADKLKTVFYVLAFAFVLNAFIPFTRFFSNEASVRSKTSRVRSDMRTLAAALELYEVNQTVFPPGRTLASVADAADLKVPAGGGKVMTLPPALTTPVAYATSFPVDAHLPRASKGLSFGYYGDAKGWILFSVGPDGDYDITDPAKVYDSSIDQPSPALLTGPWTYDPTNGTESSGDVWRVKQQ